MVRPMKRVRSVAEQWLWLGVTAIAIAGIYALVPVIGRTPQFKDLPIAQKLFDVALVVHVDMSVLIWSVAMVCMGGALLIERHAARWPYWGKVGFWCTAIATLFMALSPLDEWIVVKSNYIPVLHNGMFMFSLGLLFAGVVVSLIPVFVTYAQTRYLRTLEVPELAFVAAIITVFIGLIGYAYGAQVLPAGLPLVEHYELLFWLGGHIMQFAFTLVAMAAWLMLLRALGGAMPSRGMALVIYAIAVAGAFISYVTFAFATQSVTERKYEQTRIMIEWAGIAPTLLTILIVASLLRLRMTRATRAYGSALIVSFILFYFGGALGLMISGQNVTIPAHYHGMIVGITQGLMGLAYVMLPRFGYESVAGKRLAFWQPIVYGVGQLMHIGGLAYCGGYGILRKTAGGFEHLAPDIKVALGIFGVGGLLAISGGILFVIVMIRAERGTSASLQP